MASGNLASLRILLPKFCNHWHIYISVILGFYGDNGQGNGNYRDYIGIM